MTVKPVLITVSGTIPTDVAAQVERGERPCPDYVALAEAMDGELLDLVEARHRAGRLAALIERVGGATALLAWVCFRDRSRYRAILTDGEQVGLPLALLCLVTRRRPFPHVMIVHLLSAPKKSIVFRILRLGRYIDTLLVYSSEQRRFIVEELGVPADRVVFTPFAVDSRFFDAATVEGGSARVISSAGLEFRDYPTLLEAVDGLDARVVIAAASNWSKRANSAKDTKLPPNVELCSLGYADLRQLYVDSTLVVLPLYDVAFQAGVTTILEAMAMGKAVVCSKTRGRPTSSSTVSRASMCRPVTPANCARPSTVSSMTKPVASASAGRPAATSRKRVTCASTPGGWRRSSPRSPDGTAAPGSPSASGPLVGRLQSPTMNEVGENGQARLAEQGRHLLAVLGEEREALQLRAMLATAPARLVPAFGALRVRTSLLRAAGWRIGRRTLFFGVPHFYGPGDIQRRFRVGESAIVNIRCTFDLNAEIEIGDGASLGHEVLILTSSHVVGSSERRAGPLFTAPVRIGDGAWIGARSLLLPGITVGQGAIVAAGSVVTKDVADNTLVGGTPAVARRVLDGDGGF